MVIHRPLFWLFLSFVGGLITGHQFLCANNPFCHLLIFFFLPLFVLTAFLFPRNSVPLFVLALFCAGSLAGKERLHPSQQSTHYINGEKVFVEGTVLEPPRMNKQVGRLKVAAHRLIYHGQIVSLAEKILVTVYQNMGTIRSGERIRFSCRLRPFKSFHNPGGYDYQSAMESKGFSCAASVADGRSIVILGQGVLLFPFEVLERVRSLIRGSFERRLNLEDQALMRALILGERQSITPQLREPFNRTGLGHILAVSGLHIGLLAWICFSILKALLSRSYHLALKLDIKRISALLTCLPVVIYTAVSGFQVSGQRAMIMVLIYLWSIVLRREKEVWSTFALAGMIILAIEPQAIYTISFQLSFAAVAGILLFTPWLSDRITWTKRSGKKGSGVFDCVSSYFIGVVFVTITATIVLLPLTTFYFHRVSVVTVPANLVVVPIMGLLVLPLGLISALLIPFLPQLAEIILQPCLWGLHTMMASIRFWSQLPFSSLWVISPNFFEISVLYGLILSIAFIGKSRKVKWCTCFFAFILIVDTAYWIGHVRFNEDLRVTFLDVGHGSAVLVEFPKGKKMLIDGGGFPGDYFDVGKMVVAPTLWHQKIAKIHYMVLSHADADHMNGLRFIAEAFQPDEFWYNGRNVKKKTFQELMHIIESGKIEILDPSQLGHTRIINDVKIRVLHPPAGKASVCLTKGQKGENNHSLVLSISFRGKKFLFPGDLEQDGEKTLLANVKEAAKCDVLLSPHHGHADSNPAWFLRAVQPRVCIISSGQWRPHSAHHQDTLNRLAAIDCKAIKIDQSGAVRCIVKTDGLDFKCFLENPRANTVAPIRRF
jgi:competence protein ComEC